MLGVGWSRFFFSPAGTGEGYRKLPVLFRGKRRAKLGWLVGIGLGQAGLTVATTIGVRSLFDGVGARSAWELGIVCLALVAALGLIGILRWQEIVQAERLAQSYVHALRIAIFRHALRLGGEGLGQTSRGAVLLRFTGDLSPIRLWISRGLLRGLIGWASTGVISVTLLIIDPLLGGVVAISVLATIITTLLLGSRLDEATRRVRRRRTRMLRHAQERLLRISVIEVQGHPARERRQLARKSRHLARSIVAQAQTVGAIRAVGEVGASASGVAAVVAGAFLVDLGLATTGSILSIVLVVGLMAPKLRDATRAFEYWTGARIAMERQGAFLALIPIGRRRGSGANSVRLKNPRGRLRLVDVGYRNQISPVSLSLEPGRRLWLGAIATQKDADVVLQLAAGVLHPTRGKATLDGVDLRRVHRNDVRRCIALASSQFDLVRGSLRNALTYGLEADEAVRLDHLLAEHGLSEVFAELPGGLDYQIGESDRRLSPGQRLLAGVIRARLLGARIILVYQADAQPGSLESGAIRKLLSDYTGAVLWSSLNDPMLESCEPLQPQDIG